MPAAHKPSEQSRKNVESMAAAGMIEPDICRIIGCSDKTLRKHYREELDTAHIKATQAVAANMYRMATGTGKEAFGAACFWLKTRGQWREARQALEVSGPNGGPIEHLDLTKATDADLAVLAEIAARNSNAEPDTPGADSTRH